MFDHIKLFILLQFYDDGGMVLNYFANPITPHANLAPAFPVFRDY